MMPLLPLPALLARKQANTAGTYLYRATARLQAGYLDDAMADCQVLAQNYEMDADAWFLTGKVALEMDGYEAAL